MHGKIEYLFSRFWIWFIFGLKKLAFLLRVSIVCNQHVVFSNGNRDECSLCHVAWNTPWVFYELATFRIIFVLYILSKLFGGLSYSSFLGNCLEHLSWLRVYECLFTDHISPVTLGRLSAISPSLILWIVFMLYFSVLFHKPSRASVWPKDPPLLPPPHTQTNSPGTVRFSSTTVLAALVYSMKYVLSMVSLIKKYER